MKSSLPDHVAAEIRAEMGRQRMTQRELAEKIGMRQPALSQRLIGNQVLDVAEIEAIAAALGVPVAQFLPASARVA